MIVHGEVHNERLRVVLLRAPTVVAAGGYVVHEPRAAGAAPRARALGFDPICAVISDKDVARAVQAAVHARGSGIYNVAGREAVPLSVLARWTGRRALPVPHPLLGWAAAGARLLGLGAEAAVPRPRAALRLHARYAPRRARARLPPGRPDRPRARGRWLAAARDGVDVLSCVPRCSGDHAGGLVLRPDSVAGSPAIRVWCITRGTRGS